jgi:hypothetical protein
MHEEPRISLPEQAPPGRNRFSFALSLAAAAAVIALTGFYFLPGRQSPARGGPETHPPFGPAERAYAAQIRIENIALSRAENFLKQEVTILSGDLWNEGDRQLVEVELTVEFFDDMNQVVLRESRLALASPVNPLGRGERRSFEISFEHISTSWNMQQPAVRVTGILFAALK